MNNDLQIFRDRKKKNRWKKVMLALSLGVAVTTASLLILPAVTLEKEPVCGMEEHVHGVECYREENGEELLICELEEHQHTEACYPADEPAEPESGTGEETPAEPESGTGEETPMAPESGTGEETPMAPENGTGEETPVAPESGTGEETPMAPENGTEEEMPMAPENGTEEEMPVEEPAAVGHPLELLDAELGRYITNTIFQHRPKGGTEAQWADVQEGDKINGTDDLRLKVQFQNVVIQDLLEKHGCQVSYSIPEQFYQYFKDVKTGEKLQGDIGTIEITEDRKVLLTFDESWLRGEQGESGGTQTLRGEFTLYGTLNLKEVEQSTTVTIPGGAEKEATITFEDDVYAKYAEAKIAKSVNGVHTATDAEGKVLYDYLEYQVTVTAGADGCPNVKVVDQLDQKMTGCEYVEPNPDTGVEIHNDQSPQTLAWVVGTMKENEQKILTYRVKLPEDTKWNKEFGKVYNEAKVYTTLTDGTDYDKHCSDQVEFEFVGNMNMSKDGTATRNEEDGSWIINYQVWFEAKLNKNNNYTLRDVSVKDRLSDRMPADLLKHVSYVQNSFKLYDKKNPTESDTPLEPTKYTVEWAQDGKSFTLKVPDMEPGKVYCFTYDLTVDKDVVALKGITIENRAEVFAGNAKNINDVLQGFTKWETIVYDHWVDKRVGNPLTEDLSLSLNNEVYEMAENGTITRETAPEPSFTVPAGSYPYEIILNELGDGDIKDAMLSDSFIPAKHMGYVGYLKVEQCAPAKVTSITENTNKDKSEAVAGNLGDVLKTKWLKIDGRSSFEFQLSNLNFTASNNAYRFTYYARPRNMESASTIDISNTFGIRGDVGLGIEIRDPFQSQTTITATGGSSFEVQKQPWYYNSVRKETGNWQNGQLFWYIEVKGDTTVAAGTQFKDQIVTNGVADSLLHSGSLEGIYVGTFPDGADSIEDLKGANSLEKLPETDYQAVYGEPQSPPNNTYPTGDSYHTMTVTMKKSVELNSAKSMYLVVRTEPKELPVGNRDQKTYKNAVLTRDTEEGSWHEWNTAQNQIYSGGNILKELLFTFKRKSDGTIETIQGETKLANDYLKTPGLYAAWNVKVNYGGKLDGDFMVVDTIPEGMELSYVRLKWRGDAISSNKKIQMPQIENSGLTAGWKENSVIAGTDNNASEKETSYYYTKGNQVMWHLVNLEKWTPESRYDRKDNFSVDCQVVCRVTDPDVLIGGEGKSFDNQAQLMTKDGLTLIDENNEVANFSPNETLTKGSVPDHSKPRISYTIEVNPDGLDLNPDGVTLVLKDEMSTNLEPVPGQLHVLDMSKTPGKDITDELNPKPNWDASQGIMTITVPDDKPLQITYEAKVTGPPGTQIPINNKVYWEGYETTGKVNTIPNYDYSFGGSAETDTNPKLMITKIKKGDLSGTGLQGADFTLQTMKPENGSYVVDTAAGTHTGTTNEQGQIVFGAGTDELLEFNKVYQLTETNPPEGYVRNQEPEYLIFMKKDEATNDYPIKDEAITVDGKQYELKKNYDTASWSDYTVENVRGVITVTKAFHNASGQETDLISGTYRFGVFTKDGSSDTYNPVKDETGNLMVETLTIKEGTQNAVLTFKDLPLNETYYVFELDENGNRIEGGNIFHSGDQLFQVTYEKVTEGQADGSADHGVVLDPARGEGAVTVTNQAYISLPKTGGGGVLPYALTGAALFLGSAKALHKKHKKEKR